MPSLKEIKKGSKRMAIITSYFSGGAYGLLGPQVAATVIEENTPYECIVIGISREDGKALVRKAIADYFGQERPILGFSYLSGREDLFSFAEELKQDGVLTILAGPQANVDYSGERGWREHPHRFPGVSQHFSMSVHGPAEQAIHLLQNMDDENWRDTPGLLYLGGDGGPIQNPKWGWDEEFFRHVRWDNLYVAGTGGLVPLRIQTAQVLQQIGCPYAARQRLAEIDYPAFLPGRNRVKVLLKGCSFCDVAVDKGFFGQLDAETVMSQITCLPELEDGRKIPLELINENPLPGLPLLLKEAKARGLRLSQVNLIMRADWFLRGEPMLREALNLASSMGVRILLSSVGFESFDDRILRNLNKGLCVGDNLKAVPLMRQLKEEFPLHWAYSRDEGALHGFIHPTPWDTEETSAAMERIIKEWNLPSDILPAQSIPLIIHHASGLGDWARKVEAREEVQFKRSGSVIGWWQIGDRFTLQS
jgi:hypothetical protein